MDIPVSPDENTVCTILKEMVLMVHELVGVRMHRLSVCDWEVKLWLGGDGVASGAWRVVVTNVTGHTCTVHVSLLPMNFTHTSIREWHARATFFFCQYYFLISFLLPIRFIGRWKMGNRMS